MKSRSESTASSSLSGFLASGGEMGRRIRDYDWSQHPLGPPEGWPQSLHVAIRIMLSSRFAMWMGWGRELFFFHNDAYAPTLGIKRDTSLGQPAREVWAEIWSDIGPRAESVVQTGEATWDESLLLFLERSGYPEETYHTFSYSPIPGDDGAVGGMLCVVTEETERVIGARRLELLRDLGADLATIKGEEELAHIVCTRLEDDARDLPFALIYLLAPDGKTAQLACAHGTERGSGLAPETIVVGAKREPWPVSRLLAKGLPALVDHLSERFGSGLPAGPWDKPPRAALLVPIAQQGLEKPAGFLVAGLNPYRPLNAAYRGFIDLLAGQIAAGLGSARAYEAERKRAEALAEIDRAKTAFFSNVSHEFRTPLTLMLGPLEEIIAQSSDRLPGESRELVTVAHRNGLRLLKLVNALLDYARIEAGRARVHFEPTDLAKLTVELASAFRSAMEKAGLAFVVDCPPLPEPVHVDREMWEKIVLNLLSNAFKFTLAGEVRVTMRALGEEAVVMIVRDTGAGIPDDARPHLFERFYRVQGIRGRTHEGSGIGLALVHELVHLHGGTVRVESAPGAGSSFIVTLPFGVAHLPAEARAAAPPATDLADGKMATAFVAEALRWLPGQERERSPETEADYPAALAPVSGPRPRVLLADDNADMREYIARLLAPQFEVIAVPDGQAALEAALDERPDLVVTDVMMPRIDGFALLRSLRDDPALCAVPVILLSARAGEEARVEGLEAGADDYLTKPFHARELLAKVNSTLTLARVRAEAVAREAELQAERTEILDRMNLAFMALDPDFRITYLNAEAARIYGMTPEKYLGRTHWEAFPEANGTVVETNYRRAMTERVPIHFENFYEPWQQWFELNVYPMADGHVGVFFSEITDLKKAEQALRASEERFRQIANTMPQLIFVTLPDGKHEYFNRRWYEFAGLPDDSLGPWPELFHPDDDARVRAQWRRNLESGEPYEIEYRLRRFDGVYCWFLCRALPVRDDEGRIVRWFGTCTDIDEFKRVEESLRRTHARLQTVMNSITDGLAVIDQDWRFTYFSEQAARIVGMRPEQLLGRDVWEIFPAAIGTHFYDEFHRAVATGHPVEFEEYYPEPIHKWLECRAYPSAEGLSVFFHDITARKQAEAVLRQNEGLFSTLIEQAPLGVYVVDAQFKLQQVNPLAMPVFGGMDPLLGRDFTEVMQIAWGPDVGAEVARVFRQTLETGERYVSPPFVHERHDLRVEQAFDWETQRVTLPDGQHGVVCYFTDVTERRRAEAALQEAKDAAESANSSKDRFLAVLSHELRTPLTPVLMAAAALEHDPTLRPDLREDVAMIKRNIELETRLIDDLLDLSRILSSKLQLALEPVRLNDAVRQVCGICGAQALEKGVRLECQLTPGAGLVAADPARLQQVLWNLIKNAIKFTPEHGVVQVITSRSSAQRGGVEVRDSGIGIPPEILPRVFDAFEQGDPGITRQFGGLGLGLAISKALIALHHGTIHAESAGPGQGATFRIELPGGEPIMAAAPASDPFPAESSRPGLVRLLVVEDHPDTSRTLCGLLKRAGYAVATAGSVAGALALARAQTFDLVISDLGLPDGTGFDVITELQTIQPIPGIAMSGYGMDADLRRSREAGFREHLVKPIALPQLVAAIRRATEPQG